LKGIEHTLTGLDIDKAALEIRKNVTRDLDETVHADLRYANLDAAQFDLIYSSYVLEHIEEAEDVLQNFSRWLRKGGLLILLIPDAESVRGFITRITPHWLHVVYYRYVLRLPNAGEPGYGPYVTYYAPVVSRHGIRKFCEKHHFRIREERGSMSYPGQGLVAVLSRTLARVIAWLSLGRLKDDHADLMYILKKD
jgi:ubiquinone/menaquinone biosynthesis C-methylase UbiE